MLLLKACMWPFPVFRPTSLTGVEQIWPSSTNQYVLICKGWTAPPLCDWENKPRTTKKSWKVLECFPVLIWNGELFGLTRTLDLLCWLQAPHLFYLMLHPQGEQFKGGTTFLFRAPGTRGSQQTFLQWMALITWSQPLCGGVHNKGTDKQVREEEQFMPEFTNGLTGLQH